MVGTKLEKSITQLIEELTGLDDKKTAIQSVEIKCNVNRCPSINLKMTYIGD